jgi:hypothetical protein
VAGGSAGERRRWRGREREGGQVGFLGGGAPAICREGGGGLRWAGGEMGLRPNFASPRAQ